MHLPDLSIWEYVSPHEYTTQRPHRLLPRELTAGSVVGLLYRYLPMRSNQGLHRAVAGGDTYIDAIHTRPFGFIVDAYIQIETGTFEHFSSPVSHQGFVISQDLTPREHGFFYATHATRFDEELRVFMERSMHMPPQGLVPA